MRRQWTDRANRRVRPCRSSSGREALMLALGCVVLMASSSLNGCSSDQSPASDGAANSNRDESMLSEARERLVREFIAPEVRDVRVLEAMRKVPRHRFVPETLVSRAYEDRALPKRIKRSRSRLSLRA